MMMEAIRSVPRVESKLYPVEVGVALKPILLSNDICCRAARTRETLRQLWLKKLLMKQKKR